MDDIKILQVVNRPNNGKFEPSIRVAGKYLLNLGFNVGDECVLFLENGRIEIRKYADIKAERLQTAKDFKAMQ